MIAIFVLLLALAGVIAAWAWGEVARQRRRVKALETALAAANRQAQRVRDAYARETKHLEALLAGTDDERFHTSLDILRELSRGAANSD